jgi:hypothetical protein
VVDERGDIVVVVAPSQELDEVVVLPDLSPEFCPDGPFVAGLDTQLTIEPDVGRDVEQVFLTLGTDCIEHRLGFRRCVWRVRTACVVATHAT